MLRNNKPYESYETYDNVESFFCPCIIDERHEGGCNATCTVAFCPCIPFGTLSEWTETTKEYQHPSSIMKWTTVYVICGLFGLSPCLNVMLYNSFYSHLKPINNSYPGITCCGCIGMVCCPICAFVKMQRLKGFHENDYKPQTTSPGSETQNKMKE